MKLTLWFVLSNVFRDHKTWDRLRIFWKYFEYLILRFWLLFHFISYFLDLLQKFDGLIRKNIFYFVELKNIDQAFWGAEDSDSIIWS